MVYSQQEDKTVMKQIRQAFSVAGYNFRQWNKNPRIAIAFSLAFILCFLLSDKIVTFADQYQTTMQILEPFIWTFGDSNSILLASLILVFLFADMPFLSSGTPFYLMRTSRKIWLLGQGIYIFLATLIYLIFVLVSTSLICCKNAFAGNLWSETSARLGYSSAGEKIAIPASVKTMEMTTPYQCVGIIFGFMLLYTLLMVFFMLVFNLYKGQFAGMIAVFGFSLFGFLLSPDIFSTLLNLPDASLYQANVIVGWLSPLNHATLYRHNFGYDLLPSLWQSAILFLVLTIGCVAVSLQIIRNYSFTFTGTEGDT